ncbi:PDZ domain-containing protein, partial [bacterium]|nr:PDZ domain-containing protein [bacterium]
VGHAYRGGGDVERSSSTSVGMLGVDFALEEGAYRITAIHEGGPWDLEARGPLSQPGVDVAVGDWLLAVDGVPLDPSVDPWAAFVGKAGRPTMLTVSADAILDDEDREVLVNPLGSDSALRYRAWIEQKRAYVSEQTDGKIGYIYVPNTGRNGQNDLFRQFFGQIGMEGLVIDERWNGGGQIPTRFIELLNRPLTNLWAVRQGHDWRWPPDSHFGPKVMLINGLAGSGGDMFPWLFRQAGLGPLVGTRTWGGLVGISGNPRLIDGGFIAVPTFGFYEADGTWGVEGHGVDPDIVVVDDPSLMADGGDPQLDAAIEWILGALETDAFSPPDRPAGPDRSGMGVTEDDK